MEFKICTNCVMDTTDTDIQFIDGVCNHCRDYKARENDLRAEKLNLPWLFNAIRNAGEGKKYDCLLGLSGGVDSSLCLYYLKENGIRPYVYTLDNGYNTKEADENIMRLVEGMKVRLFRYNIDLIEFRALQKAFLRSGTKNIEIPTDHILGASSYEMAKQEGIKHIISGGNQATESVMPMSWGYQARDLTFIKAVYGKKIVSLPTMSLFGYVINRFVRGIKVHNLLDYYDYNREDAKKLLNEKYGWKDYGEKHNENTFTNWFQNWYLPTVWGIDKRKAHYSSLILSDQMTRTDALAKLTEPHEYPHFGWEDKVRKVQKRDYTEFKNSEKAWNTLANIYANIKRLRYNG